MNNQILGDICTFQEGYVNPSQKIREYFGGDIKWLRSMDLNNSFVYDTSQHLSKKGYESAGASAYLFPKNSIAISKSGTIGELAILKDEMCGNRAVININVNEKKADLLYVFYLLKYKKSQIIKKAVGSIQKNLYISELSQLEMEVTNIKEQNKISNVLFTIDSKIENNNKIIAELESMAKTIYNYWFLQFDFPDEKGKPYKSSGGKMVYNEELKREIPEGWEVETLGSQILENIKSTIQVGNAKDGSGIIPFFTSGNSIKHINDVIVKGLNIFLSTGGNAKVQYYFGDASYSTDTWCIKGKENFSEYLYYYLKNIETQMDKLYFHGTGLKHLQKPVFKKSFLYVPTKETLKSFSKIVKYNMIKTSQLLKENQELASLRDFLLPMLMNGQVTFKS